MDRLKPMILLTLLALGACTNSSVIAGGVKAKQKHADAPPTPAVSGTTGIVATPDGGATVDPAGFGGLGVKITLAPVATAPESPEGVVNLSAPTAIESHDSVTGAVVEPSTPLSFAVDISHAPGVLEALDAGKTDGFHVVFYLPKGQLLLVRHEFLRLDVAGAGVARVVKVHFEARVGNGVFSVIRADDDRVSKITGYFGWLSAAAPDNGAAPGALAVTQAAGGGLQLGWTVATPGTQPVVYAVSRFPSTDCSGIGKDSRHEASPAPVALDGGAYSFRVTAIYGATGGHEEHVAAPCGASSTTLAADEFVTFDAEPAFVGAATAAAFPLAGSCNGAAPVVITGDAAASAACTGGRWSATADFSASAEGPLALHAAQAYPTGRTATADKALTKDTSPVTGFAITAPGAFSSTGLNIVSWTAAAGAAAYDLTLAGDPACSKVVEHQLVKDSTTATLAAVPDGVYYLCLSALDAAGNPGPADNSGQSLTVDSVPPGSFAITGPAPAVAATAPVVGWTAAPGAARYRVKVGAGAACEPAIQTFEVTGTTRALDELPANAAYRVCVVAEDEAGNTVAASNTGYAFAVDTTPPGAFHLTAPSGNYGLLAPGADQTVSWTAAADAVRYDLKIGTDAGCAHVVQHQADLSSPSATLAPKLEDGGYFACVSALDAAGNAHPDDANGSFPVDAYFPVVLGRPDATTPPDYAHGLSAPQAGWSDDTSLYIADKNNNRVLVYANVPDAFSKTPTLVLGQPDLNSLNIVAPPTASSLLRPTSVQRVGTKLIVVDQGNNRVLIWNTLPTQNNQAADVVIGQVDKTGYLGGGSLTQFDEPRSAWSDGTKLFVVDGRNKRVLAFNPIPTADHATAAFKIGTTFAGGAPSVAALQDPTVVHGDASHLVLTDLNRVLIWNSVPAAGTAKPAVVIGQTALNVVSGTTFPNVNGVFVTQDAPPKLLFADGNGLVYFDAIPTANNSQAFVRHPLRAAGIWGDGAKKFLANDSADRILVLNSMAAHVTASGVVNAAADGVIGQTSLAGTTKNQVLVTAASFHTPLAIAACGGAFYAVDAIENRVLGWRARPTRDDQEADFVLGQADFSGTFSNRGGSAPAANTLSNPSGIACGGGKLMVADTGNRRVLVWNELPMTSGAAADVVIGQTSMDGTGGYSCTPTDLANPSGIWTDGTKLYVVDFGNYRTLRWNQIPVDNGEAADLVLGQADLSTCNYFASSSMPYVITGDATHLIAVSDSFPVKILTWTSHPSASNAAPDFSSELSGFAPSSLWLGPGGLFATDTQHGKVLHWASIPTTAQAPAPEIYSTSATPLTKDSVSRPAAIIDDGSKIIIADPGLQRIMMLPHRAP